MQLDGRGEPRFKEIKVFGRETPKALLSDVDSSKVRADLGARPAAQQTTSDQAIFGGAVRTSSNISNGPKMGGGMMWGMGLAGLLGLVCVCRG
ncbi:hypothetical protein E0H71_16105 [Rhizobium leguminosarum bv. viciae]|nr:hypothetical protein E0H71_16105 [Rhizobium leguminosarum bv. viciae]